MPPGLRPARSDSGSESHDGEHRNPEMPPFDRAWAERMPYGPFPGKEIIKGL